MKLPLFLTCLTLLLPANGIFGQAATAAKPAPAPVAGTAPAATTPTPANGDMTLTVEGTMPLGVAFKIISTGSGFTIISDGQATVNGSEDAKVHFEGQLTPVKDGYRLEYKMSLTFPAVIAASTTVGGGTTTTTANRQLSSQSTVILKLGEATEVSNTNGKTITMTLAKATGK